MTIEKNGQPFAIVQSYADFEEDQRHKLNALRTGIEAAYVQPDAGQKMPLNQGDD